MEASSSSGVEVMQTQATISVMSNIGQSAISESKRIFTVGDLVAVRPSKKSHEDFWIAKIKQVLGQNEDGIIEFKCTLMKSEPVGSKIEWTLMARNKRNSSAVLNENMILVHGFLLTNTGRLRKETEVLIKEVLQADKN